MRWGPEASQVVTSNQDWGWHICEPNYNLSGITKECEMYQGVDTCVVLMLLQHCKILQVKDTCMSTNILEEQTILI